MPVPGQGAIKKDGYPIEAKDLMGAIYSWHWSCLVIML